ncbi:DNA-J chaperone, putative [Bodo saltans]|uniref:DNA-J chaperone, putative n=1 Tax=Bodo saltans TaxID=75058 RepID=A0A0S4IP86_BODSA|nr:DNA-J chaperone, putative [Bodo saltans]|eukprot:CUF82364.1 DNA-J chaperone, putative [Bodo saltans]
MLRRTIIFRMTIHSPRAVPFELGAQQAKECALAKYQSRWMFGAQSEFLNMQPPKGEFIPFYLCNGSARATFTGRVQYHSSTSDGKGGSNSTTTHTTTGLLSLETTFHENTTQLYGGYKYNNRHIHSALRHDANALKMQKVSEVDMTLGSIGLFEVSSNTVRTLVGEMVKAQVRELAEKQVRRYHTSASSIQIDFKTFDFLIEDVFPVFLPCYVIKASYDGEEYTLYVCGSTGTVGAPYLVNALLVARLSCIATFLTMFGMSVNKAAAIFSGSIASVVVYYAVFYAAKYIPALRRNYYRRQRDNQKLDNVSEDATGFKPSDASQRITEEYHRSSYWDTHKHQQPKDSSSSTGSSSSHQSQSTTHSSSSSGNNDPKGYYKILGVSTNASVNDIRSAFRQKVIMHHPDAGGSTETMTKLNEAYRTLRDPALRETYDRNSRG